MKILIVEDEPDTLEEIADYTRKFDKDADIQVCTNPLLAIEYSESSHFDAALLDIQMPEMTGLELAERLSNRQPGICLAFITAYNHYASEAFEINAVDYILKPIREERLYKTLGKIQKEAEERRKSAPAPVSIQTFGKLVVSSGDSILKWKRHKAAEIFAYLLQQQRNPVHKGKLCELMWPEYNPQKGLSYLQTLMYQIRKNITEIAGKHILIEYADHCYRLCLNGASCDADLFCDAAEKALSQSPFCREALAYAEQLYTGHYLEEEGWVWAAGRQQNLAMKYQMVLETLIDMEVSSQNHAQALFYIRKYLHLGIYEKQDCYLSWVKEKIGIDEFDRLKAFCDEE